MPPGLTSPSHLFVILVVALVVLGPERLPRAAREVGRFLSQAREWYRSVEEHVGPIGRTAADLAAAASSPRGRLDALASVLSPDEATPPAPPAPASSVPPSPAPPMSEPAPPAPPPPATAAPPSAPALPPPPTAH